MCGLAGCVAALGCATTAKTLANPVSDDDVRSVQRASGKGALELNYVTRPVTMSGDASDPDGLTVTVFTNVWEQRYGSRMSRLLGARDGALVFQTASGATAVVPTKELLSIDVPDHVTGAVEGFGIGAGVGALLGATLGAAAYTPCNPPVFCGISPSSRAGAAAGLGVVFGILVAVPATIIGALVGAPTRFALPSRDRMDQ
jgi:hypothetical protein